MSNLNDVGLRKPSQESDKPDEKGVERKTHFRVTLGHDRHPHRIVSIWAVDRKSAKALAADENPDWDVVQARVSNQQDRSEDA